MKGLRNIACALASAAALLGGGCIAVAQGSPSPFQGIFEQYLETDPSHPGLQGTMSYLHLSYSFNPEFKLVGAFVLLPDDRFIDDAYAEWDKGSQLYRVGRFRSDFGFSSWSDLYYTPFIGVPMIRSYYLDVVPGISLYRLDRGAETQGDIGEMQYQVAIVDSSDDDWHVIPGQIDTGIARLQFPFGSAMLGFNGFGKVQDRYGPAEQIAGVDFRWTAPRIQFRGEYIEGVGDQASSGYYADVFYRPPKLARTQLGLRYQEVSAFQGQNYYYGYWWGPTRLRAQVLTIAGRQFLGEHFTLSVNYGAGNRNPESLGLIGWSTQLLCSFRF